MGRGGPGPGPERFVWAVDSTGGCEGGRDEEIGGHIPCFYLEGEPCAFRV